MRTVETFLWRVAATAHRRAYTSTIHRTREDALQEYGPDATPIEGSMRPQNVLETDEEIRRVMQSAGHDGPRG